MSNIQSVFPTLIYRAETPGAQRLNLQLEDAIMALAAEDKAGQRWCEKYGYPGYTSYASHNDLHETVPAISRLVKIIDKHAVEFAKALHWDIRGGKPMCDTLWVNVMPEGGSHTSHIHTNSVLSGTYYVSVPEGSGPIVYEDPRHAMMMAAPPRKKDAPRDFQNQIKETPKEGSLLLWESWLRHEVPLNRGSSLRISISFNYVIGQK
jgi:uncharacterized protein (TIGR02466 family)